MSIQKITPFLWFADKAEEAMNFYVGIFPNSKVVSIKRYPDGITQGQMAGFDGKVLTGIFELQGQRFMALDGGAQFKFTEAISLYVNCENQDEVNELWERLSEGGAKGRCGWLKDRFGVSWQIVPEVLGEYLSDPDPEKAKRVMQAMLKMDKIESEILRKAYEQVQEQE